MTVPSHTPAPLEYATPQPKRPRGLRTVRVVAWVWCGCFGLLAVPCLWAAATGFLNEPGGQGWRVYQPGALLLLFAALGATVVAFATEALHRRMPPEVRRGVVQDPPQWQRVLAWTLLYVAAGLILVVIVLGLRRALARRDVLSLNASPENTTFADP